MSEYPSCGGQAGTSSLIRNYLGFPHGLPGDDLTARALDQAWLFGANFTTATAEGLTVRDGTRVLQAGGSEVEARAVVIATGVSWRRLGVPGLEKLIGAGVFYGAASAEARAMAGQDVYVTGAGNSAARPRSTWPGTRPPSRWWCAARIWAPPCPATSSPRSARPITSASA